LKCLLNLQAYRIKKEFEVKLKHFKARIRVGSFRFVMVRG